MCISVDQIRSRLPAGVTLSDAQVRQTEALIRDASALAESVHGRRFGVERNAQRLVRASGNAIRLDGPVEAVTSVSALGRVQGEETVLVEGVDWSFDGIDRVAVDPNCAAHGVFRVVFDRGVSAPAIVESVVSAMVLRVLLAPSPTEGLVAETVGQVSIQHQQGGGSNGVSVRLMPSERELLMALRRRSWSLKIGVG